MGARAHATVRNGNAGTFLHLPTKRPVSPEILPMSRDPILRDIPLRLSLSSNSSFMCAFPTGA